MSQEDALLNELIRMSRESLSNQSSLPSDDLIYAYITETATDEEKNQVVVAIAKSQEFRVLIYRVMIEYIQKKTQSISPLELGLNKIPKRADFISGFESVRKTKIIEIDQDNTVVSWKKYSSLLVAAALIVLVIKMLIPTSSHVSFVMAELTVEEKSIEPVLLMNMSVRGNQQKERTYPTAKEAAYKQFRKMMIYDSGKFMPVDSLEKVIDLRSSKDITLQIQNNNDSINRYVNIQYYENTELGDNYSLWLIDITSKSLMSISQLADTVLVHLEEYMLTNGCICLVKQIDSLFKPVSGEYIEMKGEGK